MCATIWEPGGTRCIENLRGLLEIVPPEMIIFHDGVLKHGQSKDEAMAELADYCLCNVNIPASFVGVKRWSVWPGSSPGDWELFDESKSAAPDQPTSKS